VKSIRFTLIAAAIAAAPVTAQEIRFQGEARGCFGIGCTPVSSAGVDFLNYTGQTFDGMTRNGRLSLTFGFFTWDAFKGIDLVDSPFTLFLAFTNPTGIRPDPVFSGGAEGLIIRGRLFGRTIGLSTTQLVFEPNVRTFTFTGGQPNQSGEFTLALNDTYISANGRSYIEADIYDAHTTPATVTPEPMTVILLGSGLAGVAAARRRRKQQEQA